MSTSDVELRMRLFPDGALVESRMVEELALDAYGFSPVPVEGLWPEGEVWERDARHCTRRVALDLILEEAQTGAGLPWPEQWAGPIDGSADEGSEPCTG